MRLGLMVGYSGSTIALPMEMIKEADRLGYYAVWTAEAYGSDAVTPLAWIGAQTQRIKLGTAIMQMPARTPAMTAMTAMTLDQLSGGRMLLGLGLSGPQVVEGWHGVPYGKPLGRTREYVSILRAIFAREAPLVHEGEHYQIPYRGPDATGLGKPLKSILHGRRDLPIYLAAIEPKTSSWPPKSPTVGCRSSFRRRTTPQPTRLRSKQALPKPAPSRTWTISTSPPPSLLRSARM